jgi:hypothetical protein
MTAPENHSSDPNATRRPPDSVPPSPSPSYSDEPDNRRPAGKADAANDTPLPAPDSDQTRYTVDPSAPEVPPCPVRRCGNYELLRVHSEIVFRPECAYLFLHLEVVAPAA